jgi:hypothetical protein
MCELAPKLPEINYDKGLPSCWRTVNLLAEFAERSQFLGSTSGAEGTRGSLQDGGEAASGRGAVSGHSVSAKEDIFREMAWKLAKRNKGASLATAAALLVLATVLAVSFSFINDARINAESQQSRVEQALGAFEQEQKDKQECTRPWCSQAGRSAPAL